MDHASCSRSTARTTVKQRKLDAFLPGRRQARTSTVANSHAGSEGVSEKTSATVISSQSAISDKGKNKEHGDPRSKRENVATPAVFKTLATTADPVPAPAHSAATAGTIGTDNRTCALTDYHVAQSVDMPTSALAATPTSVPATTDVAAELAGDSTTTPAPAMSVFTSLKVEQLANSMVLPEATRLVSVALGAVEKVVRLRKVALTGQAEDPEHMAQQALQHMHRAIQEALTFLEAASSRARKFKSKRTRARASKFLSGLMFQLQEVQMETVTVADVSLTLNETSKSTRVCIRSAAWQQREEPRAGPKQPTLKTSDARP